MLNKYISLNRDESLAVYDVCTKLLISGEKPGFQRTVNSVGLKLYRGPIAHSLSGDAIEIRLYAICILFIPVIPLGFYLCKTVGGAEYSIGKLLFWRFIRSVEFSITKKVLLNIFGEAATLLLALIVVVMLFSLIIQILN